MMAGHDHLERQLGRQDRNRDGWTSNGQAAHRNPEHDEAALRAELHACQTEIIRLRALAAARAEVENKAAALIVRLEAVRLPIEALLAAAELEWAIQAVGP